MIGWELYSKKNLIKWALIVKYFCSKSNLPDVRTESVYSSTNVGVDTIVAPGLID